MNPNDPIRVKRTHKMTAVPTAVLLTSKLSFGAKGLFALFCVSDDLKDAINSTLLANSAHDDLIDELVKHDLITLRDDPHER